MSKSHVNELFFIGYSGLALISTGRLSVCYLVLAGMSVAASIYYGFKGE